MNQDIRSAVLLASRSPRRRQILESIGIKFHWQEPLCDERTVTPHIPPGQPRLISVQMVTTENALRKAKSLLNSSVAPRTVILGADTLVCLESSILGKPSSQSEAFKMLNQLSGKVHQVVTGLAFVSKEFGERSSITSSLVKFKTLTQKEMCNYVLTQEPYDKAGAYAVQGLGALFIQSIEGSYSNVMGLPVETLLAELPIFTQTSILDWFPKRYDPTF